MQLSERPGNYFAISAHLLPNFLCRSKIVFSSSLLIGAFFINGSKWLCHLQYEVRIILSNYLSRHCLPVLPDILNLSFNLWATNVHLFVPYSVTSHKMASSSYLQHNQCTENITYLLFPEFAG